MLLKEKFKSWQVSIFGSSLHTVLDTPKTEIPQIQFWLQQAGVKIDSYREIDFSLEDVFISVVVQAQQRGLYVPAE
jgi:ABC-2 type transport system ATP-binding protein